MFKTEDIWNQFAEKLKFFMLKRVKDEEIANDLLQEVFIRVHSKMETLKDDSKIKAWLFQITRNVIIDYFKKNKKDNLVNSDIKLSDEEISNRNFDLVPDLVQMMEELPEEYCEALCLAEFEGLSQKQYAEKIGISYSGAKSRVQRARKMLKDELLKCCHFQFDKYGTIIDYHPISCCCCDQFKKD